MSRSKKSYRKLNIVLFSLLVFMLILLVLEIHFFGPVNNKGKDVEFIIEEGTSISDIANNLEKEGLIKNDKFFIVYTVLTNKKNIYAAKYILNDNMSLREIVDVLDEGGINTNIVMLTFKEGINARGLAKEISENTNITYNEVIAKMKDKKYLEQLIGEYWFITKDIKNSNIYYPLEGYLFPDTYSVDKENTTIEDIFKLMLDAMDDHLSEYKKIIDKSDYSIHELMTLASVTQSEGYKEEDFKNIASVFYNRMVDGMALESCVTSYYGVKKDMTDELRASDINDVNPYNTRGSNPKKFPAGPISMPGVDAIDAVLKPKKTNYYYFVSDKNHKLYFTKTLNEHEAMISNLKGKGLWLEW